LDVFGTSCVSLSDWELPELPGLLKPEVLGLLKPEIPKLLQPVKIRLRRSMGLKMSQLCMKWHSGAHKRESGKMPYARSGKC
jgi:hypothetical protein